MVKGILRALGAEDVALLLGTLMLGAGAGIRFGYPIGLMVVGALAVVYGVWITERGN